MKSTDPEEAHRMAEFLRCQREFWSSLTPQERDRTMQVHLAQARGPVRNAMLLFEMTAMLLRARQTVQAKEQHVQKHDR